jgi:hypothetical protein
MSIRIPPPIPFQTMDLPVLKRRPGNAPWETTTSIGGPTAFEVTLLRLFSQALNQLLEVTIPMGGRRTGRSDHSQER